MSEKSQKLTSTKSNNMIDAGFFKKLNSMEMRIFNLAISKLNPIRSLEQNRRFDFSVKEFLECNTGIIDRDHVYKNVKTAVLNLSKIWVEVEPLEGYDKTEVPILNRRSYADGQGLFSIEFHEDVMPYLVEIKNNYTSMLLDTFGSLKSEYSLKMYEFLSRWAFKGVVKISVADLKILLNVGDLYPRFNSLNQRTITPAINEINAKTNLSVSMKTLRTGRMITDLEFTIFDKSKAIDVAKRPKFPHKNKYGRFVRLNREMPSHSSNEYAYWARDCLKILENYYNKIEDVPNADLLFYWIFLAVNASNKSKFGGKKNFVEELKKRGYKIVECELVKIKEKE